MSEQTVSVFKVDKILDSSTVVVTGETVGELSTDDTLWVLAVGPYVSETGPPLVLAKAELEVTEVTDYYAIARPPEREVREKSSFVLDVMQDRIVRKRPSLPVANDSVLLGNPEKIPLAPGDYVIKKEDYRAFVAFLARKRKEKKES